MKCPKCNHSLIPKKLSADSTRPPAQMLHCVNCGWETKRIQNPRNTRQPTSGSGYDLSAATGIKLLGLWMLSILIIVGPYFLLMQIPFFFSSVDPDLFNPTEASAKMGQLLTPGYWIFMGIYIAACGLIKSPNIDRGNLGWFGGLVDNPFIFSDDINRFKFRMLLLMIPGKIILVTVNATWKLIKLLLPN